MRTAIVQRDYLTAVASIEQDMLAEQRARQQLTVDKFAIPGSHIPRHVSEELRLRDS